MRGDDAEDSMNASMNALRTTAPRNFMTTTERGVALAVCVVRAGLAKA
jgi:hypothetical protein